MVRKLKTKIGNFYFEKTKEDNMYYTLLDSNKKFITIVYHKETLKKIKKITHISELVDILILHDCTWGDTISELADQVNDIYNQDFTVNEMEDYDFLNKVGNTYFVIDFE